MLLRPPKAKKKAMPHPPKALIAIATLGVSEVPAPPAGNERLVPVKDEPEEAAQMTPPPPPPAVYPKVGRAWVAHV